MFTCCDSAWAGVTYFCPELRVEMEGLKKVDAYMTNFGKWGMGGMPGAMLFIANRQAL